MKAIQTRYSGRHFRSRLEARWAVFFDVLEVDWEYELEGFDLDELGWYLPDFWLPSIDCWFEVKPKEANEKEWALCSAVRENFGPIILSNGGPDKIQTLLCMSTCDSGGGHFDCEGAFTKVINGAPIFSHLYDNHELCDHNWKDIEWVDIGDPTKASPQMWRAIEASLSTRFGR
jgi:hypothetical protein